MDHLIVDALHELLADHCTAAVVRAIEEEAKRDAGQALATENPKNFDATKRLWAQIDGSGFADLLVPESAGGAGLVLRDAFAVWDLLGQCAMPLPLAETMLARGWLAGAGVAVPAGAIAWTPRLASAGRQVVAAGVRGGQVAQWLLAGQGGRCHLLPLANAVRMPGALVLDADIAWSADAFAAVLASAASFVAPTSMLVAQAAIMSALLAGGLLTTFEKTLQYANERQQFGRPIGKFQAIQHELAVMAEQVSAARMAAQIACDSGALRADALKAAVGKARASEAAVQVAALAHSIHGAIGFTAEFDLQLYTRRLHLWRQTAGSEAYWQQQAGQALLADGGMVLDAIRRITDSSATLDTRA